MRRRPLTDRISRAAIVPMILTGLLAILLCISLLVPLIWCLYASFKDQVDYAISAFGWPTSWHPENYSNVFAKMLIRVLTKNGLSEFGLFDLLTHSIVYSTLSPLLGILFTMLMAYVISMYRNPFSKFLYGFGIVLMILPIVGNLPASMQINKALGRYDNMFLWILLSPAGCFSGMNFLLFYQLFRGVPKDYAEAARIDGAGHYRVMCTIYLPNAVSLAAVTYILSFLGVWNDWSTFVIWLPSYPNLAYGMYIFQYQASQFRATQPEILASFIIAMIPTSLLYLSMQKLIVQKLQIGGLKG